MNKIAIITLSALMFASCALPGLPGPFMEPSATPTVLPYVPATSTLTYTPVPTRPTPTFTSTPTMVSLNTPTLEVSPGPETDTPAAPTTGNLAIPSQDINGFTFVTVSVKEFYIGDCGPSEVTFSAQAARPGEAAFVMLFVRLKSTVTGATSEWTDLGMENLGAGTFAHTLNPDEIKSLESYKDPWVQYQIVATNSKAKQIGRTQIFDETLRLKTCPTATSTP